MSAARQQPGGIRGRGSSHNPRNRFERAEYDFAGEECDPLDDDEVPRRPDTQFLPDASRSIIARNDSPDVGFDVSINPYRGCEHGCAYCYARPTHEYLGFSAGLDFETRIMVKHDAPALLREALKSSKWSPSPIGMSGVTDCYQPIERKLRLSRRCLEVMAEFRQPVIVNTKNRLVTRDIDVLQELAKYNAVAVFVSITTLDLELNRAMEPRTSSPKQRLEAIRQLSAAGIQTGTLVAPIVPGLTDMETPKILEAAADAGARFSGYVALRLPLAVAPLFERFLEEHAPGKKDRVLNRIRAMRGGALYQSGFGNRMRGDGVFADQIEAMFRIAKRKVGMTGKPVLSGDSFRRPVELGDQLGLI